MSTVPDTPNEHRIPESDDLRFTPIWLRIIASWGWRLLVLAAVIALFWIIGQKMSQLVIPLLLAVLITSGLQPFANWLEARQLPRWAAALIALLAMVLVLMGLLTVVGAQIATQWPQLTSEAIRGFQSLLEWLGSGPLKIDQAQIDGLITQMWDLVQQSRSKIATGLAAAGGRVGAFFAGLATCVFAAFFFLKDGRNIAGAFEKVIPNYALVGIEPAVRGGWMSLASYVRAAVIVAAIDGVGAGLGALILGSNLWLAITAFTFVCSFVPLLGATIAGAVATVVVLVTLGPVKAIIMLVVFVLVMSIESNVLQPLLLGRAVEIHPLMVLLGIAAGAILAGIPGALFAIPLVAFITGCVRGAEGVFVSDDRDERRVNVPWRVGRNAAEGDETEPRRVHMPWRSGRRTSAEPSDTPERPGSWFRLPGRGV